MIPPDRSFVNKRAALYQPPCISRLALRLVSIYRERYNTGRETLKMKPIYLDYNATTPIDPKVVEAMKPYLDEHFGNPSSAHWYGVQTRAAVEKARRQVAVLLGCEPEEVVFTSGGTESNNYAIND
jgi:selenocysteine lyase/cysteine desulfurase